MIKILFVCHGNICRSPMAEFIMKDIVSKKGVGTDFFIESAGTSHEEVGNPIYPPARSILFQKGIFTTDKRARALKKSDYVRYDYLIGMDSANIENMVRFFGKDISNKISLLLDHGYIYREISDPWYTGDFEKTFTDVMAGCKALYTEFEEQWKA